MTLDTWVAGLRPRDLTLSSFPQLRGYCLANYLSDPVFRSRLPKPPEEDPASAVRHWSEIFGTTLTWAELPWLCSLTKLPLLLKGICHPDDVRRAIDGGVDGIYCSTHGGSQANGGIGCLDMLPGVVAAAGKTSVLFDSGVRSGSDIVKVHRVRRHGRRDRPAPMPGAWPSTGPMESSTFCGACSPRPIC